MMRKGSLASFLLGLAVLAVGGAAALGLTVFRPDGQGTPAGSEEKAIHVEVLEVRPETAPITIVGHGEVHALRSARIAAEVSGTIIEVHEDLRAGGLVERGEVLFRIDPETYEAEAADAAAVVREQETALERLEIEHASQKRRLTIMDEVLSLEKPELERARALQKEGLASQSAADDTAQGYLELQNAHEDLCCQEALYPVRLKEMRSELERARAALAIAEASLRKTRVTAPFAGRLKSVGVDYGDYVRPGEEALELTDDSELEISVPLDSREAQRWLRFDGARKNGNRAWFSNPERVTCEVRWTEAPDEVVWEGTLERVESFDPGSRTLVVAVRLDGGAMAEAVSFPLVEGMFCKVAIPGRRAENVFRVPAQAVTMDETVYVAEENRLKTRPVEVVRLQGNDALIGEGLRAGDVVIATRLIDPLENSLLEFAASGLEASGLETSL